MHLQPGGVEVGAATSGRLASLLTLVAVVLATVAVAGENPGEALPASNDIPPLSGADLGHALLCLVVAASLGAPGVPAAPGRGTAPRRPRDPAQIMMAIVGLAGDAHRGASLARAFAIAGTAGLVRYRAKIDDPKDASVMLACLAIGLASGVGLLHLAAAGAAFIVGVLWLLEWREPWPPSSSSSRSRPRTPPR